MANKVNSVKHSKTLNRVKLIYIDHGNVLNRLTVWGSFGQPCDLEYYKRLGLPRNYKIHYMSGTLAMNFYHKSRLKIYVSRKDDKDQVSAKSSGYYHKAKNHRRRYFKAQVIKKHSQGIDHPLKPKMALNQNPYDDINIILLALGYTINQIGQAIKRLHNNEANLNR